MYFITLVLRAVFRGRSFFIYANQIIHKNILLLTLLIFQKEVLYLNMSNDKKGVMKKVRTYVRNTSEGYEVRNESTEEIYAVVMDNKLAEVVSASIQEKLNK